MLQATAGTSRGAIICYVRVVIYPALIRPSLKDTLYQKTEVAIASVAGAVLLTFLFSMAVFRALGRIGQMLDRATSGEYAPEILPSEKKATDELSVMASKVNLLGQRLRGAQFEVSDLRGNIDHLLQDLEDAVFIFNREFRLIFASGAVEKFLGRDRSDLLGQHRPPAAGSGRRGLHLQSRIPPHLRLRRGGKIPGARPLRSVGATDRKKVV